MIHCTPENVYSRSHVLLWLVSAFKAGFLNSTGFLLTGEFVSHITGFGTRVGISMGVDSFLFGFELLMIPAFFILGGFLAGLVLEGSSGKYPPYYRVQILITLVLGFIVYAGESDRISFSERFGNDERFSPIEYMVTAGLCFVCGMKNALVSWTTYGKFKVTHLTGMATDIGINLIRTFRIKERGLRFNEPRYVNFIRMGIMVFFSTGAFVAALLYPQLGVSSLTIILALSFCLSVVSVSDALILKREESEELRS